MPKKQPFQKITNRELEIMQLLWNADHPLIASEIAAMKPDLTVNTVQSVLRNLLKHKYIEVAKIVYSGTVLTRSYRPLITEQDFGIDQVINDFHSFRGLSVSTGTGAKPGACCIIKIQTIFCLHMHQYYIYIVIAVFVFFIFRIILD